MNHQIVFGSSIIDNKYIEKENPVITFPGNTIYGKRNFSINENILSKHILLLGGSGCGKTNAFFFFLDNLRRNMNEDDVMIVFDTKGEFYDGYFKSGDYVIGNSNKFRTISNTWNIFDEVLSDGWNDEDVSMNAREISAALFHGRGSESQPFFCNAARDIFRCILVHFVRKAKNDPSFFGCLNNKCLVDAILKFKSQHYLSIFDAYPDMHNMRTYIGDGTSNQALGVFAELNSMMSEYFIGVFEDYKPGKSISMRNVVREKGGKAVFVEYDLSVGETLSPIYRLLIDQALKEALSKEKNIGNVYFIADEFKLLPKLQHIDDALNFGRGLGVKVVAGIQSIDQLYDIYGKEKGAVIASGFGSLFAYHTNDGSSRDYITRRFGTNVMVYDYANMNKNIIENRERDGNTVEEWDQMELNLGEAIIGLGYDKPFLFKFDKY